MRVAVQTDPVLEIGQPETVARAVLVQTFAPNYAHDADADRWLVYAGLPLQRSEGLAEAGAADEGLDVVVVENWVEWLKQEVSWW